MKNRTFQAILAILCMALVVTGCSNDDGTSTPKVSEISFPDTNETIQAVAAGSPVKVVIARTNAKEALTVRVSALKNESGIFTIPTEIEFAAGQDIVTVDIPFAATTIDSEYSFQIGIVESAEFSYTGPNGGPLPKLEVTASIAPKDTLVFSVADGMDEYVFAGQQVAFELTRASAGSVLTVPLSIVINDSDAFIVPTSVVFASTELSKTFTIGISETIEIGREYGLQFRLYDGVNKYVDANGDDLVVTKSATVLEKREISLSYVGVGLLEPGASLSVTFTLPQRVGAGFDIPIKVVENEGDMFEIPETFSFGVNKLEDQMLIKLKETAELGKDYKFKIMLQPTNMLIFADPTTGDKPALEQTISSREIVEVAIGSISVAAKYVVPGTRLPYKISLPDRKNRAVTIPLAIEGDASGMLSIPASVLVPANTLVAYFDVVLSSSAVAGTTYNFTIKAGGGDEVVVVGVGSSDMNPPTLATKATVSSTSTMKYVGMCSVTQSGFGVKCELPIPYNVALLRDGTTNNYVIPNLYKSASDFSFTWDGSSAALTPKGTAYTVTGKPVVLWSVGWIMGLMAGTSTDAADTYYTPATKTFTLTSYMINGMTGVPLYTEWFQDKITILE